VTLCTNRANPDLYLRQPLLFKIIEVKQRTLSFEPYDKRANQWPLYSTYGYFRHSYRVFSESLRLATAKRFDVVHATGTEFLTAALLLKKYSTKIPPVVMEVNAANFSFSTYDGTIARKAYKVLQREIFKTTLGSEIKGIGLIGKWQEERLRQQLVLSDSVHVAVIPDGGEEPGQPMDISVARKQVGIPEESGPVLLFFGTIRRDKGLEYLIEAVARLPNERFSLLIAGNPQEYTADAITDLIERWNVKEKVITRLGYVPESDIPGYFYACDALVLPYRSIYTGGSGPLMKGACMHRRPSIVSAVSEMGRLVKECGIGLIAQPEDSEDLANKIRDFLRLPQDDKEKMAGRAQKLAQSHTWEKMAKAYTELYQKVI
jgi:glycosyltransferase involved in cell wall biosynthesis